MREPMTALPIAAEAALATVVVTAAATDIHRRQIPNWLTLSGMAAGFLIHTSLYGWRGLKFAALGFGLAALIFLPLFLMRWLGGGDVKLMAAVAALAGAENLIVVFTLDALLGGVAALGLILVKGRFWRTLRNIPRMFSKDRSPELEAGSKQSLGLPRAVTIAAASLILLWAINRALAP